MTPKRAIGISPFELVYGIEASLPLPLELATSRLRTVIKDDIYKDGLEKRNLYLRNLKDEREEIVDHIMQQQMHVNNLFDKRERPPKVMVGDTVLLWDKWKAPNDMNKKYDTLWKGSFNSHHYFEKNSFKLAYLDGEVLPLTYNGQNLKLYQVSNWR